MSPKVIYIAGKYRGPTPWAVEQNIRAAEEVAARVWAMGMVALCPHANSRHMEGVASDEHFLAGTLELMRRCDAVVLVPNWRDSAGARAEVAEAIRLGLPVVYSWGDDAYFGQCVRLLATLAPRRAASPEGIDTTGDESLWTLTPESAWL
jgi:nucleoside 2-deoxyribosyltransferase